MKAVEVTKFGGPEVLVPKEMPDPQAGPGQAVIKVAVADVLYVDVQLRGGWGVDWFRLEPPYVAGNGVAGEVVAVGDGVGSEWVGRRVIARTGDKVPFGGYVELALVDAGELIRVPDLLGLPEALTFLHDGHTVMSLLRSARVEAGERVLITAAGGSLGTLLVPLLKAAGARVVGAAKGRRKLDFVREWGADEVVDYTKPDWTAGIAEVDVVFDGAGGEIGGAAFELLREGGRLLAYGAASGDFAAVDPERAKRRGVRVIGILDSPQETPAAVHADIEHMLAEAVAGRVTPLIGQTFPLEHAAEAHAAIEARRTVGKTLLLVS